MCYALLIELGQFSCSASVFHLITFSSPFYFMVISNAGGNGQRSDCFYSNAVLCISFVLPFIFSGRPSEAGFICIIATWRLGLWASLVSHN